MNSTLIDRYFHYHVIEHYSRRNVHIDTMMPFRDPAMCLADDARWECSQPGDIVTIIECNCGACHCDEDDEAW